MLHILLAILVSASVDSTTLMLGDQTGLYLTASYDKGTEVRMPVYQDCIIPGIEVVEQGKVDTTTGENGRIELRQKLMVTAFVDSMFYIPPIPFVSGQDTLYSEGITLNFVQPFDLSLDTTAAITDIKSIEKAPRWIWGTVRWILLGLLLAALSVGIYFLVRYIRRRRSGEVPAVAAEPERPAEEVALERLDTIRREKIWQEGKTKQYHTELTDVVREYIGRRFGVRSTEKTSDDTLRAMKPLMNDKRELYDHLRSMLTLADLVKFAKWTTTPDENEQALRTAYEFVNETTDIKKEEDTHEIR